MTVVLLLAVYAGVIISCFKLRGEGETDETFRAPTALLAIGLVGNLVLLYYVIDTDPTSLLWCAGLVGMGMLLYVIEYFFGYRNRPATPNAATRRASTERGSEMHVIVAVDGSKQSLLAARHLMSFADAEKISDVSVVGGGQPLRVGRVRRRDQRRCRHCEGRSFREAAEAAVATVAAEFAGWGPKVHEQILSGSPASEIVKEAKDLGAGLVVVASGSRGLSDTVLLGSTAQRVQHSAPCPVLVVRPALRKPGGRRSS